MDDPSTLVFSGRNEGLLILSDVGGGGVGAGADETKIDQTNKSLQSLHFIKGISYKIGRTTINKSNQLT